MAYEEFAKVYDELIYEDINYDKISKRLISIIKKYNNKSIDYLDLACGTGNVAVKMAKHFKTNYAVDLSEDMLREAFEKFKKERIRCKIICQDMTELSLNHKFDVITSVLDSTNYLLENEDLEKCFQKVYNHLNDNGLFLFDINSYYKLTNILGNNIFTYNEEEVFYTYFKLDIKEFVKELYLYKEQNLLNLVISLRKKYTFKEKEHFQDGDLIDDNILRKIIDEINECDFLYDKIEIVKRNIKSLRDLKELLNECFYENEFKYVFDMLSNEEINVMIKDIKEKKTFQEYLCEWEKALIKYVKLKR